MNTKKKPLYLRAADILNVDNDLTITLKGEMKICADADIDRVIARRRTDGVLKLNRPYLQRVKDKLAHLESVKALTPGFYRWGHLKSAALDREDVHGDYVVRVTVVEGSRPSQQPLATNYNWVLIDQCGFVHVHLSGISNKASCVALISRLNLPKR